MTQTEWENEMCIKILELIQNELYVDFRYLDVAVSALTLTPNDSLRSTATDGISFFFPPEQILRVFRSNPLFLNRAVLHSVFHCIFLASVDSWKPRPGFVEPFLRHCCRVDY